MFNTNNDIINSLYSNGYLNDIDIHFSNLIAKLDNDGNLLAALAAALLSKATSTGDVCLDLNTIAGSKMAPPVDGTISSDVRYPALSDWLEALGRSRAVGAPGQYRPLILDIRNRLYLYRYWAYELDISTVIREKINRKTSSFEPDLLRESIGREFADSGPDIDWQRVAVFAAAMHEFCVISGGPGTGKTTTVSRFLSVIIEQQKSVNLRIVLCAPTGKAAARLREAIISAKKKLKCSDTVKDLIPEEAFTIHRMLRPISGTPYFYYNENNKLPADVVVVDEASMVDVALLAKLVRALPDHCRLILVGDKDQLSSVEAGSVLGDICGDRMSYDYSREFSEILRKVTGDTVNVTAEAGRGGTGLDNHIVLLKKSYRFGDESRIRALSKAVNEGQSHRALTIAKSGEDDAVKWQDLSPAPFQPSRLSKSIVNGYTPYLTAENPAQALTLFYRFIVLCALRNGPSGVFGLNITAEKALSDAGLIPHRTSYSSEWYHGRPVMITKNDYRLGLFNGDIGITFRTSEAPGDENMLVYFPSETGEPRAFFPSRLSEYNTVFSMTVHKSQGSEFDHVMLVLPERDVPVLTRELIYTGITRAKKKITISGDSDIFCNGISRKIMRTSGLCDTLWEL